MATITHFSISQLPDSNVITSLKNGGAIALNTQYPIAEQNELTFERTAPFNNKPVLAYFKYKVHDPANMLNSNEALGTVKWVGVSAQPDSADVNLTILNNDVVNLLNILPLTDKVEFIVIDSLVGVQNLKINGVQAFVGQRLDTQKLYYADFTAEAEGGGDPYFSIGYLIGNNNVITNPLPFFLNLKIVSAADLNVISGPDIVTYGDDYEVGGFTNEYTTIEETYQLEIANGYAYATANVTVNIQCAHLSLNEFNEIEINMGNGNYNETANTIINQNILLDKFGKALIDIRTTVVKITSDPAVGTITVTLNSINGQTNLVNGSQIEILSTNL